MSAGWLRESMGQARHDDVPVVTGMVALEPFTQIGLGYLG